MRVTGIDHVQVAAPPGCEDEARRFYGELLGLEEIENPEELRGRGGVWRLDDVTKDGPRVYTADPWGNRIEILESCS